ncbi:MAG TPA: C39 family peptidase [Candidatus Egerieimonas intestinavium]|uniref:C39 family peptidase n=1 Tax=Candidatus Egerieimonas intestinavium TaxID=2840777 RepID=A0A9D1ELB9_9FIRM|nr:C39 family peptidase [Candidatus Egerieimonas intestinavium]
MAKIRKRLRAAFYAAVLTAALAGAATVRGEEAAQQGGNGGAEISVDPGDSWMESGLIGSYGENGGWVRDTDGSYFYLRPMEDYTVLAVPSIMQNPELPTGCESVALTMLLHYWGYDTLGKSEIADKYLTYDTTNFVTSFVGDPHTENGAGIFAPGLTGAANRFLKDKGDSRVARDLTGTSFAGLLAYVSQGDPVVVWNTVNMQEPGEVNAHYYYQGKTYNFYKEEHCMVLCGYDLAQRRVLVSDPQAGLIWRNMDAFASIYKKMGSNAMTIQEFTANYQNFLFLLQG